MDIKVVAAKDIRPLRNLVLRPNLPIETTYYDLDNDIETFHLASIMDNTIISIGTFYPENDIELQTKNGYRLRGMATHPKFRRKSAATKLMKESFVLLKEKKCDVLWCNARLVAVEFYKSLGFKITGKIFDIPSIGPHYKMYKSVINQ
jgi:predicted GNAT family N-acyltransferase|tara:strand:+ start:760 stop:1203 length:444 start_codon:yes stop_codon:yes gene_type:complete